MFITYLSSTGTWSGYLESRLRGNYTAEVQAIDRAGNIIIENVSLNWSGTSSLIPTVPPELRVPPLYSFLLVLLPVISIGSGLYLVLLGIVFYCLKIRNSEKKTLLAS